MVDRRDAAVDQHAEPAGADRRGDRGEADRRRRPRCGCPRGRPETPAAARPSAAAGRASSRGPSPPRRRRDRPSGCRRACCAGSAGARRRRARRSRSARRCRREAEAGSGTRRARGSGSSARRWRSRGPDGRAAAGASARSPSGTPIATAIAVAASDEQHVLPGQRQDLAAALPEELREPAHDLELRRRTRARTRRPGRRVSSSRRADLADAPAVRARRPDRPGGRPRARSCVTSRTAAASRRFHARNSRCMARRAIGSSAPKGSSIRSERRIRGEGARHADALPLAAGELARPARGELRRRQADQRRAAPRRARGASPRSSRAGAAPSRRSRATVQCGKRPPSWMT